MAEFRLDEYQRVLTDLTSEIESYASARQESHALTNLIKESVSVANDLATQQALLHAELDNGNKLLTTSMTQSESQAEALRVAMEQLSTQIGAIEQAGAGRQDEIRLLLSAISNDLQQSQRTVTRCQNVSYLMLFVTSVILIMIAVTHL